MTIASIDPARPGEIVASAEPPDAGEVGAAVDVAVDAQRRWAASAPDRAAALHRFADALAARAGLAELITREVGKPIVESRGELARAVAILRYYAQAAFDPIGEIYPGSAPGASVLVRREPLGVVLAICPWNFPLAIPLWKAAPALAYGNAAIVKPAAPAIGVAAEIAAVAADVLPKGVLTVLNVPGAGLGPLLDDERIAAATFTGSTATGLSVAERLARRGAPAQAEMGGQNPAVVLADADPAAAAEKIVAGAMHYAGQKCTATRRVIALDAVADRLEGELASAVSALPVGDPATPATLVGPLIDRAAVDQFEERVAGAIARGARSLATAPPPAGGDGFYVAPTLLATDDPGDEVNREETFGPLLTLIRVEDEAAAVAAANATSYGLVGAVHGTDVAAATAVAERLDCGLIRVNAATPGVDYYAPFGGEKRSSFGPREQGRAARDFFTTTRTVTVVEPA
ncbi:MAG: aldehyde dehydrogenase family protein [Acidobacteria bacterium]|nr:MAG: aldehyde dehydrogenase family protein [Acidobacteriota bacterium]GIK78714.1 MAG: aldehyde dehydrogenase [Actinomycetes bacterium]